MGHSHTHHHSSSTENIKVAFFLNLFFTIIEFIGGVYTNSLAITSDAIHDLGDSLSLGMAWYFQKISTKKATKRYSYGFKRFALLGAIINSVILLIGAVFIILKAIPRIINPEESDAKGMMWFAILGIIFNVFKNGEESIRIILQGTPMAVSVDEIKTKILENKEIKSIHDCHLWTMDGDYNMITVQLLLVDKSISWQKADQVKKEIRKVLHDDFQLEHITLEIEVSKDCGYIDCV